MRYEVPIERGKVYEFARAVKASDAAYFDSEPVIPPTFLTTARNVWEPRGGPIASLGFNPGRILHAEEEYVFHGPVPRAGTTFTVETALRDRYEKEGKRGGTMRFAVVVNSFYDAAGALVAEQVSTLVETARPPQQVEG